MEEGKWVFPADVAMPEAMTCNAIYSILLQMQKNLMLI